MSHNINEVKCENANNAKREIVCITCPNSCVLAVSIDDFGKVAEVAGNKCKRGVEFAVAEIENPTRTLCTRVRTVFKECPVLPVRVSGEIPKSMVFNAMIEIKRVKLTEPVGIGDVVLHDLLGLGVDVIATSNKLKEL